MTKTELIALNESEPFTQEEITVFEEKYMEACKSLGEMTKQRKKLEEEEKKFKVQLEKAMDEYGIKTIDNQYVKFNRVDANPGKMSVDLKKMEKEEPELYQELLEDYPKLTGKKKAYVRMTVK